MLSNLLAIDDAIKTFFNQLTESIGFIGYLAIAMAVEVLFIVLFVIKSAFSYEARLKRSLEKANEWLFQHKKLNTDNIQQLNKIVKKGPKRFSYYWQQFILNREGGPAAYMTEENIIEKPLKTSSWSNNVKTLTILTVVWAVITLLFGFASQTIKQLSFQAIAVSLVFPVVVLAIGVVAIIVIRGLRALNLDDIYHLYNIFARFVTNAADTLPPYIDFNLLFTPREIEKGNAQIRQYYEEMARKAKEEFEQAKLNEQQDLDYNFRGVGVDGALLLQRAMRESENYINTRTASMSRIAQIEAQKNALTRAHEDVIMDLQRKMQASKENITKLIEQQTTTTNRFEVGRLRELQDKEVKKQEGFQADLDKEEEKYNRKMEELNKEIETHSKTLVESLDIAEKGMTAEYDSFYKKVMKSAYAVADNKVAEEIEQLKENKNKTEEELINVQTQNKRLLDENETLRAKIEELTKAQEEAEQPKGQYDEEGNFIYEDGSYHDTHGYFHDVDGKVYDMNGVLVEDKNDEGQITKQDLINEQIDNFGGYVDTETHELQKEESTQTEITQEDYEQIDNVMQHNAEEPVEEVTELEPAAEQEEHQEEPVVEETPVEEQTMPVEEQTNVENQAMPVEEQATPAEPEEEPAPEPEPAVKEEHQQAPVVEETPVEPVEEQPTPVEEHTNVENQAIPVEEPTEPTEEQAMPVEETPVEPVEEQATPVEEQTTPVEPAEEQEETDEDADEDEDDEDEKKSSKSPRRKARKRVPKKVTPAFVNENATVEEPGDEPAFAKDDPEPKRKKPKKTQKKMN